MKYKYFIITLIIVVAVSWFMIDKPQPIKEPYLYIDDVKINIEIAANPIKKYNGLSKRASLCPNCGMLFVYNQKDPQPSYVMRNMNFPLDLLWIKSNTVVQINKNLPPEGETPTKYYSCDQAIDSVLEVNSGFTDSNNITIGDKIKFNLNENL